MAPAALRRHDLVRIDDAAWPALRARPWDNEARSLLAHWQAASLPLVVTRDRPGVPATPPRLCLGLPAPLRWSRRKLALEVRADAVCAGGVFPTLAQAAAALCWDRAAFALSEDLSARGVTARVYGSHGWQLVCGEPCTHADSDIDLLLEAGGVGAAAEALGVLNRAQLHRRLDGEFVFPSGDALAWREFEAAHAGRAGRVLVKRRDGVRLVDVEEWMQGSRLHDQQPIRHR